MTALASACRSRPRNGCATTRFGDAHVLQAGPEDGPPVVVFQGGNVVNPLTLAWFAPLVDRFRIHAPDTIGQPGKSAGARVSANDASLGEWAVDVLDGLGLARAGRRRDLVRRRGRAPAGGAARRSGSVAPSSSSPPASRTCPLGSMLSLAAGYLGYRAIARRSFVESTVRRLSGGDPDPLFVESTALAFRGTALDTEMPRNATPEELRGLTAPVMVIAGEHDPLFRPDRILPRSKDAVHQPGRRPTRSRVVPTSSRPACADALAARIRPFLEGGASAAGDT